MELLTVTGWIAVALIGWGVGRYGLLSRLDTAVRHRFRAFGNSSGGDPSVRACQGRDRRLGSQTFSEQRLYDLHLPTYRALMRHLFRKGLASSPIRVRQTRRGTS